MRGFFLFLHIVTMYPNLHHMKYQILQSFWGYSEFRLGQEDIIDSILKGKDTVALLPTGAGKSLCYQLPALMLEGTCLVVSPLIALMRDQIIQLKNLGIEAEFLSSELDESEAEAILMGCKNGITKLLYVSPERLSNTFFLRHVEEIQISFIAVDEAHCISEWGEDFRPSYQNIKKFRAEFKHVPCIALTATATPAVLEEIRSKLDLQSPNLFRQSFRRQNLKIYHKEVSDKFKFILDYLQFHQHSGIIYTRTRADAENLSAYLKNNGILQADYFHAGLSASEKLRRQNLWVQSDAAVLIATNAFGMGIDKDNVRFVIHFSASPSIENYYQEIGRAGRDGEDAETILLWNKQEFENFDQIIAYQNPDRRQFQDVVSYLYSIHHIADGDTSESSFTVPFQRIKTFTKTPVGAIRNILNFLNNQEIIYYSEMKTLSTVELKMKPGELELLPRKDSYFIELLLRNLPGIHHHKVHFSEKNLSLKIGTDLPNLKQRLLDMQASDYLAYADGNTPHIKFLKPRNDRAISGQLWKLFLKIQQNKLQKWVEMKFFIQNDAFCKMKMILQYFGESGPKSCGKCSVCNNHLLMIRGSSASEDIKSVLKEAPAALEEIAAKLQHHSKEILLEHLILLLDSGQVRMLNFRTYSLA